MGSMTEGFRDMSNKILQAKIAKYEKDAESAKKQSEATSINKAILMLSAQSGNEDDLNSTATMLDAIGNKNPEASKLVFNTIADKIKAIQQKKAELSPEVVQMKKLEQQILKDAEPLSGEAAAKYSGATQGLNNLKEIQDIFKLEKDESGKIKVTKDFSKFKSRMSRDVILQKAGVGVPGSYADIISGTLADDVAKMFGVSTKQGRILANKFSLLAENQLRARTGATSPEPELIREEVRSYLSNLDDPETFFSKLKESDFFLRTTAKEMRPVRDYSKTGLTNFLEKENDEDPISFVDSLFKGS